MKKDMKTKEGKKKKNTHGHSRGHNAETEPVDVDDMVHCEEDLTVLKLEFILVCIMDQPHQIYCMCPFNFWKRPILTPPTILPNNTLGLHDDT